MERLLMTIQGKRISAELEDRVLCKKIKKKKWDFFN